MVVLQIRNFHRIQGWLRDPYFLPIFAPVSDCRCILSEKELESYSARFL